MNRADIKGKRIKYLIEKRRLEGQSHISDVIYIDETFVQKNYVKYKILRPLNNSKKIRFKMSIGKGTRFSIIHAGSENGFIAGAEHISINSEINGEIFENWMKTNFLPKLPPNSVVIYDNAATHSVRYNKPPVQSSTIKTIKNWLLINNIEYNQSAKKQELLKLVKENTFNNYYNVDYTVLKAGHIPLRLPPYHCILNPIELVWAQLKKSISKYNFNNNTIEFKNLISSTFKKINPTFWQNCIRHVVKIESEFRIRDKIIDNHILYEHNYCKNFFP
jgi:transposase